MVKKSISLLIAFACILIFSFSIKITVNPDKVGNTSGNINNGARYVAYDGWIYYAEATQNYGIHDLEAINPFAGFWKMKPDYSERQRIASEDAGNLFVVGSKIYTKSGFVYDTLNNTYVKAAWADKISIQGDYSAQIIGKTLYSGITAINLDGTLLRTFDENSTVGSHLEPYKGWLYFNCWDLERPSLCRMKPNGTKRSVIATGITENFVVEGSNLYYSNQEDGQKLYFLDLNKNTKRKLADFPVMKLNYFDGKLYYISHENRADRNTLSEIFRINPDGSGNQRIVATNQWVYEFSIIDGWLYYGGLPSEIEGAHQRISLVTGEIQEMKYDIKSAAQVSNSQDYIRGDTKMAFVAEKDGWLYFCKSTSASDRGIYRVKPDGSSLTKISDEIAFSLMIVEDWIYFSNFNYKFWLFRMHLDGSELEMVSSELSNFSTLKDEWIYANNGFEIFRVKTDGTGYTQLSERGLFHISGRFIYFDGITSEFSKSSGIIKMDLDGGNKVRLYPESSYILEISDEWLYFKKSDEFGRSDGLTYRMKLDGSSISVIDRTESFSLLTHYHDWFYALSQDRKSILRLKADGAQKSVIINITSAFDSYDIINDRIIITNFDYETMKYSIVSYDLVGKNEISLYP